MKTLQLCVINIKYKQYQPHSHFLYTCKSYREQNKEEREREREKKKKMRPTSNSTTVNVDAGFRNFNSPIPYLFGGLALMLGLIAVALFILACSYGKTLSNSPSDAEEKQAKTVNMTADSEPKVVVIMAGDDIPTYLAMPVSSTGHSEEV